MRAIVAAAIERPVWQRGGLRVAGPDEDGFTFAVAALDRLIGLLGSDRPLERVALVGRFPREMSPFLGEAIGRPGLEVRLAEGGEAPIYAALSAATRPGTEGAEAVVAVDAPEDAAATSTNGSGAVAFGLADGPGLEVGPHGARNHPNSRAPDARAWVRAVRAAAGPVDAAAGVLRVRAAAAPPVLLAFWNRELPRMGVEIAAVGDDSLGPAPHLGPALEILEAARPSEAGPVRVLAHIEPDATAFAGFRVSGEVRKVGPDPLPLAPLAWDRVPRPAVPEPFGLSEGAYVARPRYLEELPSRWRFVAARCPACRRLTFPQRPACAHCGSSEGLEPVPLPLDGGSIEARTTVRGGAQPTEFDGLVAATGGYDVVLVRLAPGALATLQGTDRPPGTLVPGSTVRTRVRRLYRADGEWRYGRKAIPAEGPAG